MYAACGGLTTVRKRLMACGLWFMALSQKPTTNRQQPITQIPLLKRFRRADVAAVSILYAA
jgi:hypothetical protein